jgi:hypothetical protein
MSRQDEIVQAINELKVHFDKNLNNKYVKNIILKLDMTSDIKHNMGILLDYKTLYFDSKGTIDDIYSSIKAIGLFIKEIQIRVLPNIVSFTGDTFFGASGSKDPNDKILFQMAIKNYPMNIKLLAKMCYSLLKMVVEYDKENFSVSPAFESVRNFDEIANSLKSIIEHDNKKV